MRPLLDRKQISFFAKSKLRPFLTQPDSASRKQPFSTGLLSTGFFWSLLLSSVESIYSFCALPRGCWCEGVLLYCSMEVENRLAALSAVLRAFFASNACFARDEPSSKHVGSVGLSRKPPKLSSWRCTQPRAAKATAAGTAVVSKMASITRATAVR